MMALMHPPKLDKISNNQPYRMGPFVPWRLAAMREVARSPTNAEGTKHASAPNTADPIPKMGTTNPLNEAIQI